MTVALSLNRATEIKQAHSVIFPRFLLGEVQKAGSFQNVQSHFSPLTAFSNVTGRTHCSM